MGARAKTSFAGRRLARSSSPRIRDEGIIDAVDRQILNQFPPPQSFLRRPIGFGRVGCSDTWHYTAILAGFCSGVDKNGTTTLFAALNVPDGKIIGRCMQHHRHQAFIRFLNTSEAKAPARKNIHAIADTYSTPTRPKVREWLAQHPRWAFPVTPTSASWLNAVEGYFAKLAEQRLMRDVFRSIIKLQAAISQFLAETHANPRPFP